MTATTVTAMDNRGLDDGEVSEDSDDECNDDNEDRGDTMVGLMRKVEKSMLKLNLSELKWDGWLVRRE